MSTRQCHLLLNLLITYLSHSISGHETTTITLGFSIFELARHPEAQEKLRKELQEFGKEEPSYDDFQNRLPYLDAVLRET